MRRTSSAARQNVSSDDSVAHELRKQQQQRRHSNSRSPTRVQSARIEISDVPRARSPSPAAQYGGNSKDTAFRRQPETAHPAHESHSSHLFLDDDDDFLPEAGDGHAEQAPNRVSAGEVLSPETSKGPGFRDTDEQNEESAKLIQLLVDAYEQINDLTDQLQVALNRVKTMQRYANAMALAQPAEPPPPPGRRGSLENHTTAGAARQEEPPRQAQGGGDVFDMFRNVFSPRAAPRPSVQSRGSFSAAADVASQGEAARSMVLQDLLNQQNATIDELRDEVKAHKGVIELLEKQLTAVLAPPDPLAPAQANSGARKDPFFSSPGGGGGLGQNASFMTATAHAMASRVSELEEALVQSSISCAMAKNDYLTTNLAKQQLEAELSQMRHICSGQEDHLHTMQAEIGTLKARLIMAEQPGAITPPPVAAPLPPSGGPRRGSAMPWGWGKGAAGAKDNPPRSPSLSEPSPVIVVAAADDFDDDGGYVEGFGNARMPGS